MDIRSVGIDDQDYLYAGSWGMSMFKTTNSTILSVDDIKSEPTNFSLEQNYPNPFNPSTKIKYSVPQSSQVQIKVFDVLGNEIETLVNEEKLVGTYEVTVNAESLPSGVYFYQMRAVDSESSSGQGFVETKKMILLK
jgi:hypothetical protein